MSDHHPNEPTSLYRFFAADGTLLYVGITAHGRGRWYRHNADKAWWGDVASATVEHYGSREAALEAERLAIINEKPLHNVVHNRGNGERRPRARRAEQVQGIAIICSICGEPIANGDGYIENDETRHRRVERGRKEWMQRHAAPEGADRVTQIRMGLCTTDELLAYPAPEPWHAFHRTCDPDPDGISYWIAVERIRTWQDVVRWTSHLAEKCWYTCTDWEWVIEGLAHHGELRFRSVDLAEASR